MLVIQGLRNCDGIDTIDLFEEVKCGICILCVQACLLGEVALFRGERGSRKGKGAFHPALLEISGFINIIRSKQ
jgi:hypothetical protein